MEMVGRGHHDGVHIARVEQVLHALERSGDSQATRRGQVGIANGGDLHLRAKPKTRQMDGPRDPARADDSNTKKLHHFNGIMLAAIARIPGSVYFKSL